MDILKIIYWNVLFNKVLYFKSDSPINPYTRNLLPFSYYLAKKREDLNAQHKILTYTRRYIADYKFSDKYCNDNFFNDSISKINEIIEK